MSTPNFFYLSNTHYSLPTSIKVRQKYGWSGYGIYMAVMQLLATAPNRRIKLVEADTIKYQLRLDTWNVTMTEFIDYCFTIDGDEFYSEDLEVGLIPYKMKMKNLNPSKAGKASAAKLSPQERIDKARHAANVRHGHTDESTDGYTDESTDVPIDLHTD